MAISAFLPTTEIAKLNFSLEGRMEGFYRSRIAAGEFRQFEPAVVIRAVGGMVIGSAILRSLEGAASPLSRLPEEKVADELMNFILHGLMN